MPPTVILIRHAEALHTQNYSLPDPPLTTTGLAQCAALASYLQTAAPQLASRIELVVCSPMRRTLQTMAAALGFLVAEPQLPTRKEKSVPVVLSAEWQENSDAPCDTGTPVEVLRAEGEGEAWMRLGLDLDWSAVDSRWPSKEGEYAYTLEAVLERGRECRRWLRGREEKCIAVVSHSGFLRVGVSNRRFANADFRVFEFAEEDGDGEARLVEWELTEGNGGGLGKSDKGEGGTNIY